MKKFFAMLLIFAMLWSLLPLHEAKAAETTEDMVLWYKLDEASGTTATDSSGNGNDGVITGGASWGTDGLSFDGIKGYIKVPNNIIEGVTSTTVAFEVFMETSQANPYMLFAFGNTGSNGVGNGYFYMSGNNFRSALSLTNWQGEQNAGTNSNLARGIWKHVAITVSGSTAILYEDGKEVGRNTAVTINPSQIGGGVTTANYIGKSVYSADKYFKGKMQDFRMYNRALNVTEVQDLALPTNLQAVAQDKSDLSLGDTSGVTGNLTLPTLGQNGSTIKWQSFDEAVVANNGTVSRPESSEGDKTITLTATLQRGSTLDTKLFSVTVIRKVDDEGTVQLDKEALAVHNIGDVRGNLTLPMQGENGSSIAWASDDASIITATGEVTRPTHGQGDVIVKLTAAITKNAAATTKTFDAIVRELPVHEELVGYFFPYFVGEGQPNGEQIYFALSQGNDPLHWQELNDGNPVITSDLGEKGLRDPFIIRSPEGDKFYMIATDLKIYGNGDWGRAQREGSRSLMVWESTDLVNWSNQRMIEVAPPEAGNTWAPEAFYDESTGEYVVFWSSKIYTDETHSGDTYLKMMYATTRDFYTFTEPQIYMDYGIPTLDTTMIEHDGKIHRISKANNIIHEVGDFIFDTFDMVKEGVEVGKLQRGEGPAIFKSNTEEKWYLFIDEYGLRGYVPFETTDLNSGVWTISSNYELPSSPRHGTVIPITQSEYNKLYNKYLGVPVTALSLDKQEVALTEGQRYQLTAIISPANAANKAVSWTSSDESVATVDGNGLLNAVSSGTTIIIATTEDGGFTAQTTVSVESSGSGESNLLLWYQFEETSGSTVVDSSSHGNNGTYVNTPSFGTGVDGGSFKMAGGSSTSSSPYVKIPNGLLNGNDNLTISTYAKWGGGSINQWLFALGQNNMKYIFTSPNGGSGQKAAITIGSWQTEQNFSATSPLSSNTWKHVAMVINSDQHTVSLYVDGVKVGSNNNITIKPSDLHDGTKDYSGYIGKSFYPGDPYFGGEVDDFRIYNRALTAVEIASLAGNDTAIIDVDLEQLKTRAVIDSPNAKVVLPLVKGTDMTSLAPIFTLPTGSSIEPSSGSIQDFTQPVTYTVTGQEGETRQWTVEAKVMNSPILEGLYADPHIVAYGNKFYIYPTTDGFAGWSGTQFKVFSSDNLVDWTDHGVIFDLPKDTTWSDDRAWAPAAIEKNGKYYLYFSADTNIGVAVSNTPTGPFVDALGKPLLAAGAYSGQMIDPMAFTDDDGQSYLYFGNGNGYVVKLKDDMISLDGTPTNMTPSGFREGYFVFKRNDIYYFMWSEDDTRSENYKVAYGTGNSPMGPITKKGIILEKNLSLGIKGPGHHSVVKVPGKDEYYIVYHRFAIPNGDGTHRETTIDKMEFNEDGTIKKVIPTLESIKPISGITNVPVTGVNLVQETIELGVGEQQQLTVAVTPADATNKALIWSSDNESVAAVDADRLVKAMAVGTAIVTVKTVDGSFTDTTAVHVGEPASSNAELILHYDMNNMAGSTVKDRTGNFDGTWVNPELADWIHSNEAGALIFKGGSTSSYVTMPQGVLDGLTDVTVSTLVNWNGASQANWMYTFGQNSSKYLYYTPDYPNTSGARFGMATNAWNNEDSAKAPKLAANQWKLVTTVLSGEDGTLTLYVDGVEAATANTSHTLEQIRNTQGISGFIGKSMYDADPYFGGMIADFKVYNGALTPLEVSDLTTEANTKIAAMDGMLLNYVAENINAKILGQNSSLNDVTSHLVLSENGEFSTTVTWESSDVSIISNEGVVTRPSYEEGDQTVTLTATISDGTNTITKLIVVSVKSLPSDSASVQMDKDALTVHNINDVRGHLTLSSAGENGSSITWTSSNPTIITETGEVTRPAHGSGNVIITLTATITKNAASASKTYQAVVKELPVQEDYAGYFFSYFVGEGSANGEQIYSALSQGNDPLHWTELNDGNPVLTSELGEKGVRDPFIIRSPEGDKFYMIATDLSIYNNGNWDRAQRQGSRSIMVWESNDLVNWSEQRMVEISPPEAGNTWAPEISYDETTGEYIVFWASKLYEDETHSGNTYNKMMYAKTRDFYTFTEAEVYMDFGYSVIDTTMIKHDGKVYRFTKDERDNSSSIPYGKTIFQEVGDTILGDFEMIKEGVGDIKWVEGPTIFKSNMEEKWYLFVDEFGGRGYIPFETTDLDSGEWVLSTNYELPNHPRHGTVLPITQSEYNALYNKYLAEPVAVTGVNLDPAVTTLQVGDEMQLTATVAPAEATNKIVTWSSSNPDVASVTADGWVKALVDGTTTITVTTVDGGFTASATVTVDAVVVPPSGEISDVEVISGDQQLALSWSDPTDIDLAYVKIVIQDGDTVTDTVHVNKGEQSYIVTTLTNGKEYAIKISAVDSEGNEYSGIIVMDTPLDTSPPEEVTNAKVTEGNKKLTLRWDNPSDSDLYQIKISGYGDTQIETIYVNKKVEKYVFTGLSNGTNYEFLITTIDLQGNESTGILVQGVPQKPGKGGSTNNPNS